MSYIPHTEIERQQMLAAIGATTVEDLFDAVPASHRFPALDVVSQMSEMEIHRDMQALADANEHAGDFALFRGAGAYHHFIPSVVNHMLLRGEFYTAYTPYQPEVSQGTLQAVYEYQSMMCALTGMDAANASHYDAATGLAEAVTMSIDVARQKRRRVVLSGTIHPHYREVVHTYHQGRDVEIVETPLFAKLPEIIDHLDEDTAMVAVGYPDFFGRVQDLTSLADAVHDAGAMLCVVVSTPLALAMFKSPGAMGADIVLGDAQPLGVPLSFGGPYVGFFATREKFVRKIAGRIIGETVDADGQRAYVMTLRPREQDIKREKASSNICTNQGLMALAASVYLSLMGKNGLQQVARLNYHKAHYAADQIEAIDGYQVWRNQAFFNEFVVKSMTPAAQINDALLEQGIVGGYDLGLHYDELQDHLLMCVTEMNSKAEIDALVGVLKTFEVQKAVR